MESSDQFHESFRRGLIAGFVFASTFVIVFYMSYCLPSQLVKKRSKTVEIKREREKHQLLHQGLKEKTEKKRKKAKLTQIEKEVLKERIQINEIGWLTGRMSFTELCDATKCFSEDSAIRVGMSGIMYKATLPNGWFLAVKRLYDSQCFIRRFEFEIMILGKYNHRNIVPLIGFCMEEENKERILVYQYMSNGRLSDWLNDTTTLGWPRVIRIALGVARGLSCLHHSLHMAHLNISPEYILLGDNFDPKISNFGGAIIMKHGDVSKNREFKKDVYDFGTLLFELIRGKMFGQTSNSFSNTEGPFATYGYPTNLFENPFGFYDSMVKSLNEIEFEDEVSALLRVACDCVHPFPFQRPKMLQVYSKMSNIWERDGIF